MDLFSKFIAKYKSKDNIRNTFNDILILATAIESDNKLLTYDSLLNRFAAEYYDASSHINEDKLLIDFSGKLTTERKNSKESKGYINRGWSYSVRHQSVVQGI